LLQVLAGDGDSVEAKGPAVVGAGALLEADYRDGQLMQS
jgi:hypothetical protein